MYISKTAPKAGKTRTEYDMREENTRKISALIADSGLHGLIKSAESDDVRTELRYVLKNAGDIRDGAQRRLISNLALALWHCDSEDMYFVSSLAALTYRVLGCVIFDAQDNYRYAAFTQVSETHHGYVQVALSVFRDRFGDSTDGEIWTYSHLDAANADAWLEGVEQRMRRMVSVTGKGAKQVWEDARAIERLYA